MYNGLLLEVLMYNGLLLVVLMYNGLLLGGLCLAVHLF